MTVTDLHPDDNLHEVAVRWEPRPRWWFRLFGRKTRAQVMRAYLEQREATGPERVPHVWGG